MLAVAVAAACGSGGSPTVHPGPRRMMLRDLAAVVIVPTYERFAAEADLLAAAAAQLDAAPEAAALLAAQSAWRRTRAVWKQSEAFAIGPAETLRSAAKIDWAPIRSERIESAIASTAELTGAHVENLGANLKGLLTIEYLLFDPVGGDVAVLTALADAPRRRRFALAVAENIRDHAVLLRDAWRPGAGDFAAELGDAGQGSAAFPTVKSAVDKLVNQMIFLSEDIADTQLLAALGTRNGGVPQPEALDAHRSENGLADLLDNLASIQSVYFGGYSGRQGASLSDVVDGISPGAAGVLSLALIRAMETASGIPQPLEQAVETDEELVARAQFRAKELMRRLEIDLVSVLGTTLRFNPSDGD